MHAAVGAVMASLPQGRGGHGGSVTAVAGGTAIGGNGGRGGAAGSPDAGGGGGGGWGGDYMRGGNGGDAWRPGRPALGAIAPYAHDPVFEAMVKTVPELEAQLFDQYGLPAYGFGGDGYVSHIVCDGRSYCLNVLLHLLQNPWKPLIADLEVIDKVDEIFTLTGLGGEGQLWWDCAVKHFPQETGIVMKHVRDCDEKAHR